LNEVSKIIEKNHFFEKILHFFGFETYLLPKNPKIPHKSERSERPVN